MEHPNPTSSTSRGVVDRMKDGAAAQLGAQKNRASHGLDSIADAVRQSSKAFRDNDQNAVADYFEEAADRLGRVSTQLRQRDVNQLLGDAQGFARRQPALFIGAAFAVGLAAARFMKSSSNGHESDERALNRYGTADAARGGSPAGPVYSHGSV